MRRNDNSSKVIEAVVVPDGKVDSDATRNLPEIEALVKRLYEIVVEDERKNPENPVSIGIISPFRAQVEQLKLSLCSILSLSATSSSSYSIISIKFISLPSRSEPIESYR